MLSIARQARHRRSPEDGAFSLELGPGRYPRYTVSLTPSCQESSNSCGRANPQRIPHFYDLGSEHLNTPSTHAKQRGTISGLSPGTIQENTTIAENRTDPTHHIVRETNHPIPPQASLNTISATRLITKALIP